MARFKDERRGELVWITKTKMTGIVIKRTRASLWGPFDYWDVLVGSEILHCQDSDLRKVKSKR